MLNSIGTVTKPIIDALKAASKLKMYQPVGCKQFQRDIKIAIKLADEAIKDWEKDAE